METNLKVHFKELVGPLDKERRTHVKMESGEALFLGLGSILAV